MSTPETRPDEVGDALEDHRLLHRRMGAALLDGDAESAPSAMARLGSGAIAGLFVTAAVVALVGIVALLRPGGATAWQQPGAFIVAEETGTRYVYRDGLLSPIANYASAKLLLGNNLHVVTVSAKSLASATQGPAIGIPLAPDSLPEAAGMVGTDWSVCAVAGTAGSGGGLQAAVLPGQYVDGEPLGSNDAFLLRTGAGRNYLVWAAHAYEIDSRWLPALGFSPTNAVAVDDDVIAALPAGRPIAPPVITGVGQPGRALPGETEVRPIGTIFGDLNNAFYVMTADGLAGLTRLQAVLLLADPQLSAAYSGGSPSALPISAAQVTASAIEPLAGAGGGVQPPAVAPTLTAWPDGEQHLCLRWGDQRQPELVIGSITEADRGVLTGTDLVQLPTDGGALAAAVAGPGVDTTVYLITDSGVRYPIAGQQTLEQLGLAGVSVARVPAEVLDLLPLGPTLDVDAAAQPVS